MNIKTLFSVSFIVFILHSTLFQFLRIYGIEPNISLVFVIVFSILFEFREALFMAIFLGIFQDLYGSIALGINLFIYLALVFLISFIKSGLFNDNKWTPIFFISSATLIYYTIYFIFMYFLGANINLISYAIIGFKEMLYNVLVGLFIYSRILKSNYGSKLR